MKVIRSSDISRYLFCPICWWVSLTEGVKVTPKMKAGSVHHKHVADNQNKAKVLFASILILLLLIGAIAIAGLL